VVGCGLFVALIKTLMHMHEEDRSENEPSAISSRSKYSEY
jgi:hypothetical protein